MLPIFIVSLQHDTEKRAIISKTLNDFNLDFTFIDAIYGKELSNVRLDYLRTISSGILLNRGFPATPGEIGCTLSHLKAYQEVIDRGLDWACILEDDAILDIRFKKFINQFQSVDLDSEDLYLLGGQLPNYEKEVITSFKNIKAIGGQKFYKTIKSEKFLCRTCCYLISSDLAENFLKLSESHYILADDWGYLVDKGHIKDIYLSDFIEHPIDFTNSHIQQEREAGAYIHNSKTLNKSVRLRSKVSSTIRSRLRVAILKLYRYIEKKEKV